MSGISRVGARVRASDNQCRCPACEFARLALALGKDLNWEAVELWHFAATSKVQA